MANRKTKVIFDVSVPLQARRGVIGATYCESSNSNPVNLVEQRSSAMGSCSGSDPKPTVSPTSNKRESIGPAPFLSDQEFNLAFGMTRVEYRSLPKRTQIQVLDEACSTIAELKFAAIQAEQRPPQTTHTHNEAEEASTIHAQTNSIMLTEDFFDSFGRLDVVICTASGEETPLAIELTATIAWTDRLC